MPVHLPVPPVAAGLALGWVLDLALGDPARAHPVAAFGRAAGSFERRVYADSRARGVTYAVACVGASAGLGLVAGGSVPVVALATWTVLGGTSLGREADGLGRALRRGDLEDARDRLPRLCARDPRPLGPAELARATVESVAENTSDAVVAPLLWGAVAGVPGLLAYRAVNTLDAMVGYRSPRYERFGWAAARLDDVANLVPARVTAALTVLLAPVVGGSSRDAYRVWRRDGAAHPSPNAGQCEAAFAGALGVRLGGRNSYGGRVEERPVLGDGAPPQVNDVARAVGLSRLVGEGAVVVAVALAWVRSRVTARVADR